MRVLTECVSSSNERSQCCKRRSIMMTTSCSGTSGPSNGPPLGDTDSAVLADVMAFLDDFDDSGDRDAWLADTPVSPTAVSVVTDPVTPSRSTSKRSEGLDSSSHRPRPYSAAKNKARVNRYWKRKEELQVLRSQAVSLKGHLDLLQQCARSPMEIEVTSALGVTIRSAYRSAVGKMDWKHRAAQEEQLRYHSERINAQLRQLLIFQRQWTSELGVCLQSGSGAPIKVRMLLSSRLFVRDRDVSLTYRMSHSTPQIESNARSDGERLDDRISILRCVYEEARMLANLGAVLPMAPSTSLPETKLKSPIEWTTSFSIPVSDPRRVGKMWWDSFHKMVDTLEAGTVSLKVRWVHRFWLKRSLVTHSDAIWTMAVSRR